MGASLAQRAVDERRLCYHEALVRNAYLRHSNWISEQGWGPEDEARYYTITTACEVLRYRRPVVANCDALRAGARPILPLNKDDNVYVPLARLELAARFPERASELFPWRKESESPSRYWRRAIGDLHGLELLHDNSDFGLNVLIRLLYLHGQVPGTVRSPWRTAPGRSPNFDAAAQRQIERALLTYKYWHDEPFRAVNERALRVARRDRHLRDKQAGNAKKVAEGEKPDAIEDKDRDADGDSFKYEMQVLVREPSDPLRDRRVPRRPVAAGRTVRAGEALSRAGEALHRSHRPRSDEARQGPARHLARRPPALRPERVERARLLRRARHRADEPR